MAFSAVVGTFAAAVALVPQAFAASLCMEDHDAVVPPAGGSAEGDMLEIHECNGHANQKWEMEESPGPLGWMNQISSDNLCLHVDGDASDRSLVDLVHCHTLADYSDQWYFLEGQIQSVKDTSVCLDAYGDGLEPSMSAGIVLQVRTCNQQSWQMWGYDSDQKTIYLSDSRRLSEVQSNESYVAV